MREIQTLARRRITTNPQNTYKRYRKEERRIMILRIAEKNRDLTTQRKEWRNASEKTERTMSKKQKRVWRNIKSREFSRIWALEKKHKENKLGRNFSLPKELEGVLLDDSSLEEEFGNPVIVPIILGDIQASENIKSFLKIPLKFRLYPQLKKINTEIETEAKATKERWSVRDISAHPGESYNQRRERLETEARNREPDKEKGKADFTNLRATMIPSNKMLFMPPPVSDREEILIGSQKNEVLEVVENFILEECDQSGRPRGYSNMTKSEELGRKEIRNGIQCGVEIFFLRN